MPARAWLAAAVLLCAAPARANPATVATTPSPHARIHTCPAFATSAGGSTALAACVCAPGSSLLAGLCAPCPANSFKNSLGNTACTPCPVNTRSLPGAVAVAECLCAEGYTFVAGTCATCLQNFYKTHVGNAACKSCPIVSPNVNPNLPAALPATALSGCICGPGFSGPPGGPCGVCQAGSYCRGFVSGGAATPCDDHSSSPAGASDDSDCVCLPGFWLGDSGLCQACPPNQHCPGDNLMYACPSNSTAPVGSTNETDCVCDSGFIPNV